MEFNLLKKNLNEPQRPLFWMMVRKPTVKSREAQAEKSSDEADIQRPAKMSDMPVRQAETESGYKFQANWIHKQAGEPQHED